MTRLEVSRTLVKSPPELWAELSEVDRLASHLEAFGEIRITRVEPQQTVAWEGERADGTVSLEPSGWGTKVTLEASVGAPPPPEPETVELPVPSPPPPQPTRRAGFGRLMAAWRPAPASVAGRDHQVAPPDPATPPAEPETTLVIDPEAARQALDKALDDLGSAHHRPFSRG